MVDCYDDDDCNHSYHNDYDDVTENDNDCDEIDDDSYLLRCVMPSNIIYSTAVLRKSLHKYLLSIFTALKQDTLSSRKAKYEILVSHVSFVKFIYNFYGLNS